MGTLLYSKGIPFEQCFDELNVSRPALIQEIHAGYVRAGAEIIETNTYGANRYKLEAHGLDERMVEINAAGVRLARASAAASGRQVYVAASVGPLGVQLAPVGVLTRDEAHAAFREQIAALATQKPDALIFETFGDLKEITEAIHAAHEVCDLPVLAQMTFTSDGVTPLGFTPVQVARALAALKVNLIGVNCSVGPAKVLPIISEIIETVRRDPRAPTMLYFSAQPNAGFPEAVKGRVFYPSTPEYFGEFASHLIQTGVTVVGGCCGTTAEHTAAMRIALDALKQLEARPARTPMIAVLPEERRPIASEPPTDLQQKLDSGRFIVSVELDPPRGYTVDGALAKASILKRAGVDAIDIADSPRAQMRMSAWAVAHLVNFQVGIETVLHFPVRGRNLLRVHGDLLAAHALKVRNIFAVMGDPPALGSYPGATDTYDLVPSGLTRLIKQNFNRGYDHSGKEIGPPCSFTVGVAVDLHARDVAREIKSLHNKVAAGADFALTQPVFEPKVAREFLKAYEQLYGQLRLPLLIGILPLASSRHAEFLHNEVPGIVVGDAARERMRLAGADGRAEGLRIAQEVWQEVTDIARGVYLLPPFGRPDVCVEFLNAVRKPKAG